MIFQILEPSPNIRPEYLEYLCEKGYQIIPYGKNVQNKDIEGIIIRSSIVVDKKLLDTYSQLKYILRIGVGLDTIDIEEAKKRNIIVKNTPGANSSSVAELVLLGTLTLLRNTYKPWKDLEDRFSFLGDELQHKTIGIIGFGAIGKKIYHLINAFGENNFLIYDPYLNPDDFSEKNIKFVSEKQELFKDSDIISFHIPLLESTQDFLSGNDFSILQKDVKIINTSRGGIINENDLIQFLHSNHQAGAFIDTWVGEPGVYNPKFNKLKNVIITPHIGAMTHNANKHMHFFDV